MKISNLNGVNKILNDLLKINYVKKLDDIKQFLNNAIIKNDLQGFVFGLSGGIDSTVIAHLCSHLNKLNTLVLIMPDSKITPKQETEDAIKVVGKLNLNHKLIDISFIVHEYSKYLEPNEIALGNLRSRIRSNILYYYSNMQNYLVVGTTDKSEYLMGYFTKFGDGAVDILPLISLYKTQLKKFAQYLQIHETIINKKSSPYILKNQSAETDIGLTYDKIDAILCCLFDKNLSIYETSKLTMLDINSITKIYDMCTKNQHKRKILPSI